MFIDIAIQSFSQFQNITDSMMKYFLGNHRCMNNQYIISIHTYLCLAAFCRWDVLILRYHTGKLMFLSSQRLLFPSKHFIKCSTINWISCSEKSHICPTTLSVVSVLTSLIARPSAGSLFIRSISRRFLDGSAPHLETKYDKIDIKRNKMMNGVDLQISHVNGLDITRCCV